MRQTAYIFALMVLPVAVKSFQTIFMKPNRIMDYCYAKNSFNFDSTQNGDWQPLCIFTICLCVGYVSKAG